MKTNRGILFATLCVSSLALAQFAFGDDNVSLPAAPPAATTKATSWKEAWPTCKVAVGHTTLKGVPNFGKLNANIWRSGQPSREGYANLAKQGLKTVVNLREEFPQDKDL